MPRAHAIMVIVKAKLVAGIRTAFGSDSRYPCSAGTAARVILPDEIGCNLDDECIFSEMQSALTDVL